MTPHDWIVDFPTLGDLWDQWVRAHCRVPDRANRGDPFVWSDWQFWNAAKFGQVRPDIEWDGETRGAQAFEFRRMQTMAPQKTGKGPWSASMVCLQAVGPSEFDGWAEDGEVYRCSEHGCYCGFAYQYLGGEPKGRRHPSPLIQLTGFSEESVESNIYRHLRAMIRLGPLQDLLLDRGTFVRIVGQTGGDEADRIDIVTASANSRVGNPVSFVLQDETGLWTPQNKMSTLADNQIRGLGGMSGRSIETTNAFDPSMDSVAQRTYEAAVEDIYRFHVKPPEKLRWENIDERRAILELVYTGSPWVNLEDIMAVAAEVSKRDPHQAERFFGNRIKYSQGAWLPDGLWRGALHVAAASA